MFSYSYQPQTTPFPSPSTPRPLEPRPVHVPEDRILGTIPDDLVTLDYLFGVASWGQECSFVQYKPTEKHKKCAGLKVDPVQQINMFTKTLRDKSVPIDVCLQTRVPSLKKILWIRVSLAEVTELSLEPLWLIKGRVQLDRSKRRRATITIDDHSLEPCFLDPGSQLLCSHPDRTPTKEFLGVAEEGVTGRDLGDGRESDDDQRSNDGERDEPHEEHAELAFAVTRKRKVCNVKEDDASNAAGVPPPHKKCKPLRGSRAASSGPETGESGDEDKRGCRTPPCAHKTFIRGTRTRMKSRQDVKRAMNAVYNMRSRRVRSDPVSRYQGDGGEHPLPPSHSTTSRGHSPERATPAEDIPRGSHVQPSSLAATVHDRKSASNSWSPDDSASPFVCPSAAVETPTTIPSEETSSSIRGRCSPLQSQPPEPQQNSVPQPRASTSKPPKGLGCSLM